MRKTKNDWLETGLSLLGNEGIQGLTIEKMLGELGVTKGSFYHHFRDVKDFQEQLLQYWAGQYFSTSMDTPYEKKELLDLLDTVMEKSFAVVTKPEIAIRVWAQQDENVHSLVKRVDEARRIFILKVFTQISGDETKAGLMTDILTSMLVGSMTVIPRIPPERVLQMYKEFKSVYGLS